MNAINFHRLIDGPRKWANFASVAAKAVGEKVVPLPSISDEPPQKPGFAKLPATPSLVDESCIGVMLDSPNAV